MTQTFTLKKGELTFNENKIIITDDAARQRRWRVGNSVLWLIYGIASVFNYLKYDVPFLLWTGLLIGIGNLLILVTLPWSTARNEIDLNEMKSIQVKRRLGRPFVYIKLNNNRVRRITRITDVDELQRFIEKNLATR